jgi:hypothetical protein
VSAPVEYDEDIELVGFTEEETGEIAALAFALPDADLEDVVIAHLALEDVRRPKSVDSLPAELRDLTRAAVDAEARETVPRKLIAEYGGADALLDSRWSQIRADVSKLQRQCADLLAAQREEREREEPPLLAFLVGRRRFDTRGEAVRYIDSIDPADASRVPPRRLRVVPATHAEADRWRADADLLARIQWLRRLMKRWPFRADKDAKRDGYAVFMVPIPGTPAEAESLMRYAPHWPFDPSQIDDGYGWPRQPEGTDP